MRPFSREPSTEFERISLDDLSRPEDGPPSQGVPTPERNTPVPGSLSPSRPIIFSRVSLRRKNTSTSSHWRRPSYSRVDSSTNPTADPPDPSPQYDEEGGVDPDLREVEEGLNVALGTSTDIGSWLPTTRQPSFRRAEQISTAAPQIIVEDTSAEEGLFVPDEREGASLTENANEIAGAPPVQRARTVNARQRPRIDTTDMLGSDLGAVERRGSAGDIHLDPTSPVSNEGERSLSPGGNSVIRHLRKASQRVVNIANTGDHVEGMGGFPFTGTSPTLRPTIPDEVQEFSFPSLAAPSSPLDKLSTEFSAAETGHSPWIETVELRGKSLGIFGPDNALRSFLCNVLLHPYVRFQNSSNCVVLWNLPSCLSLSCKPYFSRFKQHRMSRHSPRRSIGAALG
jgi:hypothetical protein